MEKNVDNGNNQNAIDEAVEDVKNNPDPEEPEKLFTQKEVNEIIKKRLERNKTANNDIVARESALEERERALADLENKLKADETKLECRLFLQKNNYPADFVDVLDTTDFDAFKAKAEKLAQISTNQNRALLGSNEPIITNNFNSAFSPDFKHEPKDFTR